MMKGKPTKDSVWTAMVWGLVTAVLFSILGAAIGASILNSGGIRETGTAWVSAMIWGVSIFCGTMLTLKLNNENILLSAGITAGGYVLILTAVNLLFFEQSFSGFGRAILAILAGSGASVLLNLNRHKTKGHKTRYRPR